MSKPIIYKCLYLDNMYYEQVAIVDRENGKKIDPNFVFLKHGHGPTVGNKFSCRQSDIDSALAFKQWEPVDKIPEEMIIKK